MKHASPGALDGLEPFLCELRTRAGLKEKSRGSFYRGSRAFLHFHEHGDEFYADIRLRGDFERFPATTAADHKTVLERIDAALAARIKPR
ncbi:MAG TPA: hypothetical protein VGG69_04065 [Rhizomicrobium sp.]